MMRPVRRPTGAYYPHPMQVPAFSTARRSWIGQGSTIRVPRHFVNALTAQFSGTSLYQLASLSHLRTGSLTDFIISCDSDNNQYLWKVHQNMMARDSDYFKALLTHGFKERNEGKLVLDDQTPEIIARMIVYTYDYEAYPTAIDESPRGQAFAALIRPEDVHLGSPDTKLQLHAQMVIAADRYMNQNLLGVASENYIQALKRNVDTDDFITSVDLLYTSVLGYVQDSCLVKVIVNYCHNAASVLRLEANFAELVQKYPDLGADLFFEHEPAVLNLYCNHCMQWIDFDEGICVCNLAGQCRHSRHCVEQTIRFLVCPDCKMNILSTAPAAVEE